MIDMKAIAKLRQLTKPGDDSLLINLINLFIESAHEGAAQIFQALNAHDWETVRSCAHSLKSSSANLGAVNLAELCQRLEELAIAGGPVERIVAAAQELESERLAVAAELRAIKSAAPPKAR